MTKNVLAVLLILAISIGSGIGSGCGTNKAPGAPTITTVSPLPDGEVGVVYSDTLAASGGSGSYTWSITSGDLPGGLTLSSSGVISGTPTSAGASAITVKVTDTAGGYEYEGLDVAIMPGLAITTTSLPNGDQGKAYRQTIAASGGSGIYTWSIASGTLPDGLVLSSSGIISGTPTSGGGTFTVQVTDSLGGKATQALSIMINVYIIITP